MYYSNSRIFFTRNKFNSPKAVILLVAASLLYFMPFQKAIAQNINIDGATYNINHNGTFQDLLIPNNDALKSISFTLQGGDGGRARIRNTVPIFETVQVCESGGGNGATVNATFAIGAAGIPAGSTLRFIVGGAGQSGISNISSGIDFQYGGGGGGTAVLYKAPASSTWNILAVAGGGGGAYQGMAFTACVDSEDGRGGRNVASGGGGTGDLDISGGGINGNGGGGNEIGGGGGGAFSSGGGVTCLELSLDLNTSKAGEGGPGNSGGSFQGGYGGDSDNCLSFTWRDGGYGFGGGGAGSGSGGGGGGYSGGGNGGSTGAGGGGGSIVLQNPISASITGGGNTNTPNAGVISYSVELNQPPVAICKNINAVLIGNEVTITPAMVNNGSTDPDGEITSITVSPNTFTCANLGANTVTLQVTDNFGDIATCTAIVTVLDNTNPMAKTKDITIYLNAAGNASIVPADINNVSSDNCSIVEYIIDKSIFNCSNIGANTVTLTVKDQSGNEASAKAIVTVVDDIKPTILTKAKTIYLSAMGMASITVADINNGSFDNCGIQSLMLSKMNFDCSNVGDNVVTLMATDVNGNTNANTAIVTVIDDIKPTVLTKAKTIYLSAMGMASITVADINNGSFDNCVIQSLMLSKMNFDCSNVGDNVVSLMATDVNGNTNANTAIVTVVDDIKPTVLTKAKTIYLNAMGMASIMVSDINNGSFDNCGIQSLMLSKMNFDCSNVGDNTVTLTVTDVNGNTNTNTAIVTVIDNINPSIVSLAPSPANLWPPNHKMVPVTIAINSFDNCPGSNCKIIKVESNEPLNAKGDGNTEIDWLVKSSTLVDLRAERQGTGGGRIYTITIECTDASGNKSTSTTIVKVAHDQGARLAAETSLVKTEGFSAEILGNPTASNDAFRVKMSNNDIATPIVVTITAGNGKSIEKLSDKMPNSTISFGEKYQAGLYIAQIQQGSKVLKLKLIKK